MAKSHARRRGHNSLVELVIIVAVALGLALGIQAFLVKPFRIPSESMVPTLEVGQRVLVDRVSFRFGDPDRGDIVVFKPPHGADLNACGVRHPSDQPCPKETPERSDTNFIKRVVAVPGDRLKVLEGLGLHQRKAPEGAIRQARPGVRHLQPAPGDHDSRRPLLHDGRQPRSVGRQP